MQAQRLQLIFVRRALEDGLLELWRHGVQGRIADELGRVIQVRGHIVQDGRHCDRQGKQPENAEQRTASDKHSSTRALALMFLARVQQRLFVCVEHANFRERAFNS